MFQRPIPSAAALALLALLGSSQHPEVGLPAPAIEAAAWLHWEGEAPTLESLKGRVVLLEFWGTWCGPCVRSMPGIQRLHDRYLERGLTVLAISYETTEEMQPFLEERDYTMPVGSDPERRTIAAYGIQSWPTSIVLDGEGRVAHVGTPYDAEAAIEEALGLEAGPAPLLTSYLDASKQADRGARRAALERLVEKAPADFDLQGWARSHLPPETAAEGAPAEPSAPFEPAAKPEVAAALLQKCVEAWKRDDAARAKALQQLAEAAPVRFDLASFARELYAKEYPLEAAELKELLQAERFPAVVDAIVQRAPAAKVLSMAAKHRGLAAYCAERVSEARADAKRGLMVELWLFPLAMPEDEELNKTFFSELAMNGIRQSADKKEILAVALGGEMIDREQVAGFVRDRLSRSLVMDALADGKAPRVRELEKLRAETRQEIVRDLERRYGEPKPRGTK